LKIKEFKGFRALNAVNIYTKLVWGIGLTYFNREKTFENFIKKFEEFEIEKKRVLLTWACLAVELDDDEKEALTRFATDDEGIAYEKPALIHMKVSEIIKIMAEVALQISETKVFFYTNATTI
jgi:hypothetical protein